MSKKLTFILYDININDLDKKYNINIQSNITSVNCSSNKTNIKDLQYTTPKVFSYIDEAKKTKKCNVSMYNELGNILPEKTEISCHWCRHRFSSIPIGCPIKKENNNYIVDGIYCSFNCVLAKINSSSNYLYEDSHRLLCNLYKDTFNEKLNKDFKQAPDWRLLKEYGGTKTIEEFRDNFNRIEYKDLNNFLLEIPKQKPIGWVFEEVVTF